MENQPKKQQIIGHCDIYNFFGIFSCQITTIISAKKDKKQQTFFVVPRIYNGKVKIGFKKQSHTYELSLHFRRVQHLKFKQ